MAGELQPLDDKFAIVDAQGRPTLYFIKWAQQRQIDIGDSITVEQLPQLIADYLSDHNLSNVQEILDQISTTHGAVLFRGASDWAALAPGTAGDFLKTNGPGADPEWAAGGGGGGGILYGAGPPSAVLGSPGDFYFDTLALDLYGPKAAPIGPLTERYWAIVIDNCNSTQIPSAAEIQFYNLANVLISPVTPFMINNNVSFPTARMTDGILTNFCLTNRNGLTPREIFWIDAGAPVEVNRIRYYRRDDGFGLAEAPTAVRIYAGATPPVAPWTPVTHRAYSMTWTGSAGEFKDLNQPQYNDAWPIALTS